MGKKIVINPFTRISGFLEIEVNIERDVIVDAKSRGLLYRGFERMLQGRPPLDAIYFTERICGICSTAHSMASTLALEDALRVIPENNDNMVRQFIHGCEFIQNHLRHFYQYLLPDFVKGIDIPIAYEPIHNDYRLPEKLNQKLAEHYIKSTKYSRKAHEMLAILGGKAPHNHGIFVGGVTVNIDASKLISVNSILHSIKEFVISAMIEDVYTIAKFYQEYFENGGGYGNLLSYGIFDSYQEEELTYVNPGVLIKGKVYPFNPNKITENIYSSWYQSDKVKIEPTEGYAEGDVYKEGAYSWVKAPRYEGLPMEVGPLARMWLSGNYTRGISTMDRIIARVLEVKKIIDILEGLLERIEPGAANQGVYQIPETAVGRGLIDTTRGGLGHWISIENSRINHYTIITPTTWNLSPTDSKGLKGTVEKALIGTHIEKNEDPVVKIGRIVRSFDPCVSCATHVISNNFEPITMRIV